jgi:hypothetical protein
MFATGGQFPRIRSTRKLQKVADTIIFGFKFIKICSFFALNFLKNHANIG